MQNENYLRYSTISELSDKDQDTWYELCYGLKKTKMMPMCLVCGNRMGRSFRCKNCGYDLTTEYEQNKTISMISKMTESVVKKRENYQKQVLENALSEQKRESDKKIRTLEDEIDSKQSQITALQGELKKFKSAQLQPKAETKSVLKSESPVKRRLSVGEVIQFGSYPYTKEGQKVPVKWKVLDIKNGKALLQSVYGLDVKPFDLDLGFITWELCSLRNWLNKEFVNIAFNKQEQRKLSEESIRAENNPRYDMNPGNDTRDRVFLLSINEAEKYYKTNGARRCKATPYAEAKGAEIDSNSKCSWWWLRSPGTYSIYAACVGYLGSINYSGKQVDLVKIVVRPAMWINL